jgi:hypothetical protein
VTPAAVGFANFSSVLQKWCFTANGRFYFKRLINNQFDFILGFTDSTFIEGQTKFPNLGAIAVTGLDVTDGWLTITSSTVGQRGMLAVDIRNEATFDSAYFITPVFQLNNDDIVGIQIRNLLRGVSSSSKLYIRLSDTLSDFDVDNTLWVALSDDYDTSALVSKKYGQIKAYSYISKNPTAIAPALNSMRLITKPKSSSDDQWIGSMKHSSLAGASPFYVAFRLQYAYLSAMPSQLIVDILDDSENIVQTFSSVTNAANFSYTTNDGVSWLPLGTIPNVALTTEFRVLVSSPPGGKVRARVRAA